jgi:hypothetical protein
MRSRSIARWVALAAACLSLVGSAAPAWESSRAEGPVAAMVVRANPVRAVAATRPDAPKPRAAHAQLTAPAPRPSFRATRALYVLHRALLR